MFCILVAPDPHLSSALKKPQNSNDYAQLIRSLYVPPCLLTLVLLVNIVKHRLQVLRYTSKIVCKAFQSRRNACDSKTLPEEERTILFCFSIRVCIEDVLNHKALFVRGGLGCSGKRCSSLLDSKSDTLYEHVPDFDALKFRELPSYSMQYSMS